MFSPLCMIDILNVLSNDSAFFVICEDKSEKIQEKFDMICAKLTNTVFALISDIL
jgi:hypothetical protein